MEIPLLAVLVLFFDKSLFHTSDNSNHANCIPDQTVILSFVLHIYAIDLIENDSKMYRLKQSHLRVIVPHSDAAYALVRTGNMDVIPKTMNSDDINLSYTIQP